jgi:hypothetical protein
MNIKGKDNSSKWKLSVQCAIVSVCVEDFNLKFIILFTQLLKKTTSLPEWNFVNTQHWHPIQIHRLLTAVNPCWAVYFITVFGIPNLGRKIFACVYKFL